MLGYIYKTTNLKNGKIYIGQHIAKKFEPNRYIGSGVLLQQAIARYGIDAFKCELLCECFSADELNEREQYYIKLYNTQDRSIGYNIAAGGEVPWNRGQKMSLQYCQKNSMAQRQKAPNISCFDYNTGKLIQVFNSCYDAVEFVLQENKLTTPLKTMATRIHAVCKFGKGHAYNYIWRFEHNYLGIEQLPAEELEIEHTQPKAKPVGQFSKQGELIKIWESAASYSRTVATDYTKQRNIAKTVCETCTGRYNSYRGYIWKFMKTNDEKEVMPDASKD